MPTQYPITQVQPPASTGQVGCQDMKYETVELGKIGAGRVERCWYYQKQLEFEVFLPVCSHHRTTSVLWNSVYMCIFILKLQFYNFCHQILLQSTVVELFEGLEDKYFRLCGPYSFCHNYCTLAVAEKPFYTRKWMSMTMFNNLI